MPWILLSIFKFIRSFLTIFQTFRRVDLNKPWIICLDLLHIWGSIHSRNRHPFSTFFCDWKKRETISRNSKIKKSETHNSKAYTVPYILHSHKTFHEVRSIAISLEKHSDLCRLYLLESLSSLLPNPRIIVHESRDPILQWREQKLVVDFNLEHLVRF